MTTAERLRSYWGERQFEREALTVLLARYWQVIVIVAVVGLAAGLRLWGLGERAIHHDESIHIKFAYDIAKGGVDRYVHDPVYHGPWQYFAIATIFKLPFFGDSDYTARLAPALLGIALVGLPLLLRRQLGTIGAFLAVAFLAFSPTLLYVSRFAREDIHAAFFTLAIAVCIWRYVAERRDGWLIAIAPLLAFSFAAKEITFITVAILIVFLNYMVAADLVQQLRASRRMSAADTVVAYAALLPTAWLIVALWPLLETVRKRFSFTEMPAAGPLLIIVGTMAGPQYAPGIQKLPFIGDEGYQVSEEQNLMRVSVLTLLFGSAYVGLLWNWRVWLIAAALFYVPYVLLFTSFFTHPAGFWTGIWGSMDYWLGQQLVRRGNQPDYYYFMLTPVYEFLPLVFAIGGTFYYAFRAKLEQILLSAAALALVLVFSLMPESAPLVGEYHIQAAFVVAIAAVLFLSMDIFTKFLLFWVLSILFALTVAGEKMPWLSVHIALPLALLGA
ncbi:MAG: TIGR03663 family protein, partial [Dehalococcoidia bacterium]|nr:TIGR03663 family protein [Dehalococcoidia bacterium]